MADDAIGGSGGGGSGSSGFGGLTWATVTSFNPQAIRDALPNASTFVTAASSFTAAIYWENLGSSIIAWFVAIIGYNWVAAIDAVGQANAAVIVGVGEWLASLVFVTIGEGSAGLIGLDKAFSTAEAQLASAGVGAWLIALIEALIIMYLFQRMLERSGVLTA